MINNWCMCGLFIKKLVNILVIYKTVQRTDVVIKTVYRR